MQTCPAGTCPTSARPPPSLQAIENGGAIYLNAMAAAGPSPAARRLLAQAAGAAGSQKLSIEGGIATDPAAIFIIGDKQTAEFNAW
jgi:hypothetical protein